MNPNPHHSSRPRPLVTTACAAMLASIALTHADAIPANLIVHNTGKVTVRSSLTLNNGNIIIEDGGVMEVHSGSTTTADTLEIQLNGMLTGCGTINAHMINLGTIQSDCGAATYLQVNDDMTNDGTINISNDTALQVSGTLTNNPTGVLDLRGGGSMSAGTFINNGTFYGNGSLGIISFGIMGINFEITATTLSSSNYVMELNFTLSSGGWIAVTPELSGVDGPLTFTHIGGGSLGKAFYRIREVTP